MNMTVLFKKYTYGLLLAATTLISFCSATTITVDQSVSLNSSNNRTASVNAGYCVYLSSSSRVFNIVDGNNTLSFTNPVNIIYCFDDGGTISTTSTNTTTIHIFDFNNLISSSSSCDYSDYELKSNITESYCTNKFNTLIPISAVDSNYCSTNGLCNYNCPEGTGNIQWSALYINEIQHQGNENINITIPEEIERDYANVDDTVNIEITGYGYDQNKMQQLVNTQYYTPTGEDMASLVGKIADFLPLLAIMLLIVRTRYLIKKAF